MAATEYIFVEGKLSWVKAQIPNEYGKWTVTVHPNQKSLGIIQGLLDKGMKNTLKKDDDNQYYMTFSRATSMQAKGKVIGMQPPEVLIPDGTNPDGTMKTKPLVGTYVGNGSDGIVKLEWYVNKVPGKNWSRARFLSVLVTNLVPFEMKKDFSAGQQEAVAGLVEQKPEQLF